jgi:hypothetical protein
MEQCCSNYLHSHTLHHPREDPWWISLKGNQCHYILIHSSNYLQRKEGHLDPFTQIAISTFFDIRSQCPYVGSGITMCDANSINIRLINNITVKGICMSKLVTNNSSTNSVI